MRWMPRPSPTLLILDQVAHLPDVLDLLSQVVGLKEVTKMSISLVIRNLVKIKKALVDSLLKFKSSLYSIQGCSPLCGVGLGDVLVDHPAAPVGLILGQLDSMLTLLIRLLLEVSCEPSQGLVVAVEIGSH